MAYSPIAFIAPNYSDYGTYWLKAYTPGSTLPKTLAIDPAGTTTFSKIQLNVNGFFKTAGGALLTPYVEGSYDAYLFQTEAEANSNNTAGAIRVADNITPITTSGSFAFTITTVGLIATTGTFSAATVINSIGYTTSGDGGAAPWKQNGVTGQTPSQSPAQLAGALLNDGLGNQWALVPIATLIKEINVASLGATGLGVADDYLPCQAAHNAAESLLGIFDDKDKSGITVFYPQGKYRISQTLKVGGTGHTVRGASRNGSLIISSVAGIVMMAIGDVDNAGAGRTWFSSVLDMGFVADAAISEDVLTVGLQIWNILEGSFERLHINRLGIGIEGNRSYENSFRDIFIDQNGRTNKSNYGILFRGLVTDGRNSVGNHLSDIEIRGTSGSGQSKYLSCIEVRSSDGFYMDNCHLYQGDSCFSLAPSASLGENKIEAIMVNNCYFDQCLTQPVHIKGSVTASGQYQNIMFSDCYYRGAYIDGGSVFPEYLVVIAVTAIGTAGLKNIKFDGGSMRGAGKTAILCNGESSGNVNVNGLSVQNITFEVNNLAGTATYSSLVAVCDNLSFINNKVLADANPTTSLVLYSGTAGSEDWKGDINNNDFSVANYTSIYPVKTSEQHGMAINILDNNHAGRGSHRREIFKVSTADATPIIPWSMTLDDNQVVSLSVKTLGFDQVGQKATAFWQTYVARKSGSSSPIIEVGGGLVTDRAAESDGTTDVLIGLNSDDIQITITGTASAMDWMIEVDAMFS
jgi:hypothetical protein